MLLKNAARKKDADKYCTKETAMEPATLLRRLFLVFVSNTLSEIRGRALVIFARCFYNKGFSMQDHTGSNRHGDLFIKQTAFMDEELETYLETLQLESSIKKTPNPKGNICAE